LRLGAVAIPIDCPQIARIIRTALRLGYDVVYLVRYQWQQALLTVLALTQVAITHQYLLT